MNDVVVFQRPKFTWRDGDTRAHIGMPVFLWSRSGDFVLLEIPARLPARRWPCGAPRRHRAGYSKRPATLARCRRCTRLLATYPLRVKAKADPPPSAPNQVTSPQR